MSASKPFGVAVIGCGNISNQYLKNLTTFPDVRVLFCADIDAERAKTQAATYGVPASGSVQQALEHPDVQLVVNLTIPAAHAEVASAALAAGKHVWNEKPLAPDVAAGRALLDQAAKAGLRVGCAPDTVLGAGIQSARRLIASGAIGTPLSALVLFQGQGPERWHPDPEFLFARGAGPLFDMGPYYLSVLATLFGPATRVAAVDRKVRATRVIGSGPREGTEFPVEMPTYISALAEYAGGQTASLLFSWDSPLTRVGFVEITGSEATLALPDPNRFDGNLRVRRAGEDAWTVIDSKGAAAGRGSGVVDMVRAIRDGRPHRASGEIALHVLELMTAIERSGQTASFEPVESGFDLPAALTEEWDPYVAGA
ncbi:MAG TPA: Gfo/Idh/MocA family oxidoreductase [Trebonia sp.]|jgi:predicted dehydrogenase|nr:Gfo/Idh/MocA family oxidoreductase [Trebonia sp.]